MYVDAHTQSLQGVELRGLDMFQMLHCTEMTFPFQYIMTFQTYQSLDPLAPPREGEIDICAH